MKVVSKQKSVEARLYKRSVFKSKRPGAKKVHNILPLVPVATQNGLPSALCEPGGSPFNLHVFEGGAPEKGDSK